MASIPIPPGLATPDRPSLARWRPAAVVAGVTALLLLPFLAKPLNIDDPLFVWCARQIAAHPADPYGFDINWARHPQPFWQFMQNPPLASYYLAAASRVVGWGEVGLHAALLPIAVAAAVGTYLVAAEFCRRPAVATLLTVGSAAFLVSATTLMCDVPLLCLWVWSLYLWIRGSAADTPGRSWALLLAAGVATSAALLTKYPGMNLIPLLAFHAVILPAARRRAWVAQAVSLLLPFGVLIGFDRLTAARYGRGLVLDAIGYSRMAGTQIVLPPVTRALNALCYTGGAGLTVAGVALVALLCRRRGWPATVGWAAVPAVVAGLASVAARRFPPPVAWVHRTGSATSYYAEYGTLAAAGVAVLAACVAGVGWRDPSRRRSGLFLLAWVVGVYTFAFRFNWSVNVRSVLPLMPAACVLGVRAAEGGARRPLAYGTAGAAAAAFAVALAVVDQRLGQANRDVAARWAAGPPVAPGQPKPRVLFGGHWGFQYYMQLAGASPIDDVHPDLTPGHWVILPSNNYGGSTIAPMELIDQVQVAPVAWLSTMSYTMGAGFYFSSGDRLPFVVGPIPPEWFTIYRIKQSPAAAPTDSP